MAERSVSAMMTVRYERLLCFRGLLNRILQGLLYLVSLDLMSP